jgi:hypothetical protein
MTDTLLISPDFFGYPQTIAKALEARGRKTTWINDRPGTDIWTKAIVRLSPSLLKRKSDAYFEREVGRIADHDIRDVVVIKGEALSLDMIARMRAILPRARFTFYFWDSFRNMPNGSSEKIALFDRAFSFDPVDVVAEPRLIYRPLFYTDRAAKVPDTADDIDLLFIGTAHSDRVNVVDRISRALPAPFTFRKVLYVRSRLLHQVQRISNAAYRRMSETDFIFTPMPKDEVNHLVTRSKVVLDIERNVQTGYTMRTIEMLGASQKIITTNPSVKQADFYHPNNQHVVDRENPRIDPEFMGKPWVVRDETLLHYYSLNGWIDDVFG